MPKTNDTGARAQHNTRRTQKTLKLFLSVLADTANISEAARHIGISRKLAYTWRDDEDLAVRLDDGLEMPFHEAWDNALETACDELEATARRRAMEGEVEPLIYQGFRVYKRDPVSGELLLDDDGNAIQDTIRKYDNRMLEILLKAHRPEKFRERHEVEHKGNVGGNMMFVPAPATADEYYALMDGLREKHEKREEDAAARPRPAAGEAEA